jgi:hypothetical protein
MIVVLLVLALLAAAGLTAHRSRANLPAPARGR